MSASEHIYLVMDAGSPVAAFTVQHEMKAYFEAAARNVHEPAGLHVRGQSRSCHHDHVEGVGRLNLGF